jgi:Na+/melibiose symporter-like transporter
MPKLSEETRVQIRYVAHHPVKWIRGDGLPREQVRPWEQAVHIVPNLFVGLRNAFTYKTMWMYQNVFGVSKRQQSVASVSSAIWDGVNDPLIGAYMDSRNYPVRVHRWISRVAIFTVDMLKLLLILDFGLTTWQRIGLYIAVQFIADIFGTANSVSSAKIWAHATPYSSERAKLSWASGIGSTIHEMIVPIGTMLIGLRELLGWKEESIVRIGAMIFTLPAIFMGMGYTFMLQRVPDKPSPPREKKSLREFALEIWDCFMIMRHNRYFMLDVAARFLTVFTPSINDDDFYRFCGVDEVLRTGKLKGESLLWIRDNIVSAPGVFLQPSALPIIKRMGGSRNTQAIFQGVASLCCALRFAVGMRSQFGVLFSWAMEMVIRTLGKLNPIAGSIIKYEMLDYVEWKTGRRSEGVSMAVDGLLGKFVLNNIDTVVGSLVIDGLGFDPKAKTQPPLFIKWAPVLYLLVPAVDNFIYFIARLLYKYPASLRDQVEAELVERRRLAEEEEEELAQAKE